MIIVITDACFLIDLINVGLFEELLTNVAKNLNLDVHGSLWILDRLPDTSIITRRIAYSKLKHLMSINPRLPVRKCQKRLKVGLKGITVRVH